MGHLKAEERTETHLACHAIAQVAQIDQSRLQGDARFLRRFPDRQPLGEVCRGFEDVVNLVGSDRHGRVGAGRLPFEWKTVERRALARFGCHPRRDNIGNGARRLGGMEPDHSQLAHREVVELVRLLEERASLLDNPGVANEGGLGLFGSDALAGVLRRHIRARLPIRRLRRGVKALINAVVHVEKPRGVARDLGAGRLISGERNDS